MVYHVGTAWHCIAPVHLFGPCPLSALLWWHAHARMSAQVQSRLRHGSGIWRLCYGDLKKAIVGVCWEHTCSAAVSTPGSRHNPRPAAVTFWCTAPGRHDGPKKLTEMLEMCTRAGVCPLTITSQRSLASLPCMLTPTRGHARSLRATPITHQQSCRTTARRECTTGYTAAWVHMCYATAPHVYCLQRKSDSTVTRTSTARQ